MTNKRPQQSKVAPPSESPPAPKQVRARKSGRTPLGSVAQVAPRAKTSKREQLAALLVRDEGATIEHMTVALGWLPHTVRAALTGLKKYGYAIDSDKIDGLRTYRAVPPK